MQPLKNHILQEITKFLAKDPSVSRSGPQKAKWLRELAKLDEGMAGLVEQHDRTVADLQMVLADTEAKLAEALRRVDEEAGKVVELEMAIAEATDLATLQLATLDQPAEAGDGGAGEDGGKGGGEGEQAPATAPATTILTPVTTPAPPAPTPAPKAATTKSTLPAPTPKSIATSTSRR